MSNVNIRPEPHSEEVRSMAQFIMMSKEGKRFDGYVKDERGNYMLVVSKPEYILHSNAGETLFVPQLTYTYMLFKLAPKGVGCWVWRKTKKHLFFDRNLEASQAAVTKEYGANVFYIPEGSSVENIDPTTQKVTEKLTVFIGEGRTGYVVNKNGVRLPNNITVETDDGTIIFATSDDSLDPSTLYRNRFGSSYIGEFNPKKYDGETDDYSFAPESRVEWGAYFHDLRYDKHKAAGEDDAIYNTDVFWADAALVGDALGALLMDIVHPNNVAGGPSANDKFEANTKIIAAFGLLTIFKAVKTPHDKLRQKAGEAAIKNIRYPMPYSPF